MKFTLEIADESYVDFINKRDTFLSKHLVQTKLRNKEIIVANDEQGNTVGWLRYGYFWDCIPFMNMLYLDDKYRKQGIGRQLVHMWEDDMRNKGYKMVMTSTLANEEAQFFYRKLGYKDSGSLLLDNEPALEIMLTKKL